MSSNKIVYKDKPHGRFGSIMVPTEWQRNNPYLSGYEAEEGKKVNSTNRGWAFQEKWEELGLDWCFVEKKHFSENEHWIIYIPYYWRTGNEFYQWERSLIQAASKSRPKINQTVFGHQMDKKATDIQLGSIGAFIMGPVSKISTGMKIVKGGLTAIDQINKLNSALDIAKCGWNATKYHEECVKVIQGKIVKKLNK